MEVTWNIRINGFNYAIKEDTSILDACKHVGITLIRGPSIGNPVQNISNSITGFDIDLYMLQTFYFLISPFSDSQKIRQNL